MFGERPGQLLPTLVSGQGLGDGQLPLQLLAAVRLLAQLDIESGGVHSEAPQRQLTCDGEQLVLTLSVSRHRVEIG